MMYSKKQLALMYYPDLPIHAALRNLRVQFEETPGLMEALEKTGFRKGKHLVTPKQQDIIKDFLGPP